MRGLKRWGLSAAATFVALLAAEVAVRILLPQLGWAPLLDNLTGWASAEYQEFDPTSRDERVGMLVLGDSFLAGSALQGLEQRFPIVLQRMIPDQLDARIFASGGWGTDQELLAMMIKGRAWRPDIVVLAFCANNDISNNMANSHAGLGRKPYFVLGSGGELDLFSSDGSRMSAWPRQSPPSQRFRSYLWDLLRFVTRDQNEETVRPAGVDPRYTNFPGPERPHEIQALQPRLSWTPHLRPTHVSAYVKEDFETNRYQWLLTEAILKRMKAETDYMGAELVIMLLPVTLKPADHRFIAGGGLVHSFDTPEGRFTFRAAEPRDRLSAIAHRLDVRFFDPTPEFIARAVADNALELFWPDPKNVHFSAAAHQLLAQQLHSYLFASELLN